MTASGDDGPPAAAVGGGAGHHVVERLDTGWEAAAAPPDAHAGPARLDELTWSPARVPGTAAGVLADLDRWRWDDPADLDAQDWWFRTRFDAPAAAPGEEVVLGFDGIATVAEVFLNGERVLDVGSMFEARTVDVGTRLRGDNELAIRCRALAPMLHERRKPRARWRTRLVDGNLRFFRTMLLGRAPGFASGPAPVGPWRPVWIERRSVLVVETLELQPRVAGTRGEMSIRCRMRVLGADAAVDGVEVLLTGRSGGQRVSLALEPAGEAVHATGELVVPDVEPWWPHTHGAPALYDVRLVATVAGERVEIEGGRVGFRTLAAGSGPDHDPLVDGLDLHVNGVRVFARGALWTPVDHVRLATEAGALRSALEQVRASGMNMLRIPGTSAYEEPLFHDLCDELGILVWQDLMFANLDYPFADEGFLAVVEREARDVLGGIGHRPSLTVLCGNSEIEQQVGMLGLDPTLGRGEFFGMIAPAIVRDSGTEAIYVPSAPCGGDLPFRPNRGIANYYGVGGYRRPLEDARRAEVRFAAECLAFSNVPDQSALERMLPTAPTSLVAHHPRWKAGVPRDVGTGWDFEDVRDHYLALLYGVDPGDLRRVDHARYLDLSRSVTGEVMAEVFGEWRRAGSPCGGGLILWLRDLVPGAGWGVIDNAGDPKVAYHHLRRALAPVAVWTVDEGLGGIAVHVANDRPQRLEAQLRVALYRDFQLKVDEAIEPVDLPAHSACDRDVEAIVGRFVDASWAYRFGPPAQDLIVTSLEREGADGPEVLSQAMRFPAGRPLGVEPEARVGIAAIAHPQGDGTVSVTVRTERLAYGVRVDAPGFEASDDAFPVEPGGARVVLLRPREPGAAYAGGTVTALNLAGRVRIVTA